MYSVVIEKRVMITLLLLATIFAVSQCCVPRDYGSTSIVCVCNSTYCDTVEQVSNVPKGKYVLIVSSKDGDRFSRSYGSFETTNSSDTNQTLYIDREKRYQKILGFGGAVTDSAGINILSLSNDTKANLMKCYFSEEGLEYAILRVPIGGTDFSTRPYTLDDLEGDDQLKFFSLQNEDTNYKIPIIKEALEMRNNKIKLFSTAWTAPTWMKSNHAFEGIGFLKKEYFQTWAVYHQKFFQEYLKHNISFWGFTTGNEPANGFTQYIKINDMGWIPPIHAKWIANNLGPVIRSDEDLKDLKIMIMDDQRVYFPWIPTSILSNKETYKYVDGIAVHYYTDEYVPASVLTETHKSFPEKFILATEACEGSTEVNPVILGSWERGENYCNSIIDDLNNWATGWLDWNIALNLQGGPTWAGNYVDSPVLVNATSDEFYKQPMYYVLGHFAKFVRPDSTKIKSTLSNSDLKHVAFERPDGAIVVFVFNPTDNDQEITIQDSRSNKEIQMTAQKRSISTIIYS